MKVIVNAGLLSLIAATSQADTFFSTNGSIDGSLCVGSFCEENELFTNNQLRLKSDRITLQFEDVSSSSFPNADWEIRINDNSSFGTGGTEHFTIANRSTNRDIFRLEGNAPVNSVFVSTNGDIGLGTSLPEADLHFAGNSNPMIRLENNANSWDIRTNSSFFWVQNSTDGNFPFVIDNDAPDNSFWMVANGDVGLGTMAADASLHVTRTDGTAKILVEEASGTQAVREMFQMSNNGGSYFTLSNTASGRDWFFTHENNAAGRFIITSNTSPSDGLFLAPNGNMTIGGVLTQNSDRNAKMAIVPVDPGEILRKVVDLPLSSWTYKDDTSGARHVGPMAQDFHAAFGLGETATGISTLDTSGVALASIKALHNENQAQAALIRELTTRLEALEAGN